ncbi:CHRD domain-containing protein [Microvirga sp. STR05]|uniref:CHRD domain-containing protein n=1 Tax=Hymenobacter duratus TaxID=2771356 RepID=A0ABR8JH23_9BACT|nr:CHRD domain-containing protein [Hymenobacter duratus]MBD2715003.1 CHRD domain-containing protein [Hymenobacter duratus]MBR7949909.1 CHRD domain-containing protein [Microvirga sp. STR05]
MKQLLTRLLLLCALLSSSTVFADHQRPHLLLGASLSGSQEVPAVATAARGAVSFTLNNTRDTLFISGAFNGLSGPVTMAHTHLGFRGVAGPVVTDLFRFIRGNRIQGYLTGADIDRTKLDRYLRGGYYINIHTAANPAGEIRGQIEIEKDEEFVASLSGAQEVPPVTTAAVGIGTFNLAQNQDKLKFRVVVAGLSGPITMAHFHQGATGVAGPVVLDLMPFVAGNVIEGEVTPTPAIVTAMLAGQIYINVHTAANPGGEIRGQLIRDARYLSHDARFDGAQMVPAVTSTAKAVSFLRLNSTFDTLRIFVAHTGLSSAPTSLTLFQADAGQANPATPLTTVTIPAGTANAFSVSLTGLNTAAVNLFLQGGVNMVFNTAANPNGEIRGQVYRLAREGYVFSLNGAQERPTPVTSPGYGSGFVSMDRDQSNVHFSMAWGGLSGPATMGHFHTGLRTQAGPVVFDLMPFFDSATLPSAAEGFWLPANPAPNAARPFTARRALQFRRDSVYVNLHTAANPSGEIRGQVFRGARDLSVVLSTQPAALVAESFATFPNPVQETATVTFEARSAGSGTLVVADLLGRTVATQVLAVRTGANRQTISLPGVAPGVYLLTVEVAGSKLVSRIVKQ